MKSALASATILVLLVLAMPVYGQSNLAQTNTSSLGSVEDAIGVPLYFNGTLYTGPMNFTVGPGSHSALRVTETYPWASYSSLSPDSELLASLTIAPFPATTTMASWLHVSLLSNSVAMTYGGNTSFYLHISVDNTPATQGGAIGGFEVQSHYVDPVTGISETELNVINITPTSSASNAPGNAQISSHAKISGHQEPMSSQAQFSKVVRHGKDPPWAIGVGLCETGSTSQCNGYGVGWGSINAIRATEYYFTWGFKNGELLFDLNAKVSSNGILQAEIISSYGQNGYWEYRLEDPSLGIYTYMWSEGPSGSVTLEIAQYSGCTDGWIAYNGGTGDCFSSYISGCCPNTSTLYGVAQEPSAFESYDSTQSDFNSLIGSFSPAFQYSTNDGSTWSNPPTGMLVNANNQASWGSYVIGNSATPTWFLEAGYQQCTASQYLVQVGESGAVCNGATNTYDTQLF